MSRKISIASISMAYELRKPRCRKDNYLYVEKCFQEMKSIRPDIVALPEVFALVGLEGEKKSHPQDLEFLRQMAKKYRTWVIGSLYRKLNSHYYNSALIINRDGQVLATYDKIHPTETEIKEGVIPGDCLQKPIKTSWAMVGVQICFDANWQEDWTRLTEEGAEIIFFLSAFPGGSLLTSLATLNHVFIVPSTWSLDSGIIDNTGRFLVKTDRFQWWVCATIDLDRTVYHWDYQGHVLSEIRKQYGRKITIETFGPEGWFVLTPQSEEVEISEVEKRFSLVRYRKYIQRAEACQNLARKKHRNEKPGKK